MKDNLDSIFKPKSIAIIGASTKKGSIGRELFDNILHNGFNGLLFPVNPRAKVINSVKCYPSINAIPDPVDLAFIVVPRNFVLKVIDECGRKKVKGLVVISAGFKEIGGDGIKLEQEMIKRINKYGMRMIGPNCMGIINARPEFNLAGTFAGTYPKPGKVGYMSQSGALGAIILDFAYQRGIGFSMFASVGNKADVKGKDLLKYWGKDKDTEIILLYLENFGEPRKFTKIAREISKQKPIIAVKAGRTSQGARAVSSHTGVLAGLDLAADALMEQCGVTRVSSVEEMFDLALAFSHQPPPAGKRVAVVTNAGGPGILATDACVSIGLEMAKLTSKTQEKIKAIMPVEASVHNPIDMIASAGPEQYYNVIKLVGKDPNVDAIIVIFVPPLMIDTKEVSKKVAEAAKLTKKTVLGCIMGREGVKQNLASTTAYNVPMYTFPESCVKVLMDMYKYNNWRTRDVGKLPKNKFDKSKVEKIIKKAQKEQRSALLDNEVRAILKAYKISVVESKEASSLEEILNVADEIGYPVVMKVNLPKILHKTDVGGVILDIRNETELLKAYKELKKRINKKFNIKKLPVIVQEMMTEGKETVMGMFHDPQFGPLIMFGLGGIYVEYIRDVTFKIPPVTDVDADEMIKNIRGYKLLTGVRGEKPVDTEALKHYITRLSKLVSDFPEIAEIDINPFIICQKGVKSKAVDGRILLVQ